MAYPSSQLNTTDFVPTFKLAQFLPNRLRRFEISLLIETALVTIAAIFAIRVLTTSSVVRYAWFVAPGILVTAALIPPAIGRRQFARIGLGIRQAKFALPVVCRTCVVVFPATFFGLCLLKFYGLGLPLQPMLPQGQGWICWLFYQFMYIAVAEEVFFRGYLQNNILGFAGKMIAGQSRLHTWLSISVSAACFAAAHVVVQGRMILVLTFLPGLICGWLFARTRSLLAPILFHGLANICFCVMTAALA